MSSYACICVFMSNIKKFDLFNLVTEGADTDTCMLFIFKFIHLIQT